MMRMRRLLCIAALLNCLFLLPASAQTPNTGLIGVGGDLGVFFPDEAQEKAFTLDGFGEFYWTPRTSLRAMFSWASPGFENRTEDHFRQFRILFNGVYNWEMGAFHPFATAGAGFYFVRELLDGAVDPDSETRGGLNFGGGAEYFMDDKSSIKGEARWDIVSHPSGFPDATGFSLTIGYKRYF
jgi:opacity protein-like surface antigen